VELQWDWPAITTILLWKLAPKGVVITKKDLGDLPKDLVMIDYRDPEGTHIRFSWLSIQEAIDLQPKVLAKTGKKAGVSELQGRWEKTAVVILWKLAKDGCILTHQDRERLPVDKMLLASGHAQDIEYRFADRREGEGIARFERDNEGKMILEFSS
jgi:hypothetical protein